MPSEQEIINKIIEVIYTFGSYGLIPDCYEIIFALIDRGIYITESRVKYLMATNENILRALEHQKIHVRS